AIRSTPPQTAASSIDYSGPTQWMELKPGELSGAHYYREAKCDGCHNVTGGTAKAGPNLLNVNRRHDKAWMLAHFKNPAEVSPGTAMPAVSLKGAQLNDLVAFVMALTPDNGDILQTAPEFAVEGATLYQKNTCGACHAVNGA